MDGENNGKTLWTNGWFGGTHHFRKHPHVFFVNLDIQIPQHLIEVFRLKQVESMWWSSDFLPQKKGPWLFGGILLGMKYYPVFFAIIRIPINQPV